ncbi:hypothetical protein J6590_065255 [Homalodisca vitripennis]|nr:hypothetical protein J6590_065255 [Homalodisca vitripennis]
MKTHIKEVEDWASFCKELDNKNLLLAPFCGDIPCEDKIKEESASSKSNSINLCLQHRQEQEYRPTVMMDHVLLKEAESVKFLGMYLDRGLTWDFHIDRIYSKVASGIYVLRNLAKFCSIDVLTL